MNENLLIGTCSWNYPSWVGDVYTRTQKRSVDYLPEYAQKYRTVEIDSWFYKMPERAEVISYRAAVDPGFVFSAKVPQEICLTHLRPAADPQRGKLGPANPGFLSPQLFQTFLDRVEPLLPQLGAIMLEFEYLSKAKMPSPQFFLDQLDQFLNHLPPGLPIAIEPRNADYLVKDYFELLAKHGAAHVFSEKLFLPHIWELFAEFKDLISDRAVIRLLGDDRKAMEELTKNRWDKVVVDRPEKANVVGMIDEMLNRRIRVLVNVNNHYEGASPSTIRFIEGELYKLRG